MPQTLQSNGFILQLVRKLLFIFSSTYFFLLSFSLSNFDRSLLSPSTIEFVKDGNFKGFYKADAVQIRRLSTKSKVKLTAPEYNYEYFTEWKWYWQNGLDFWKEYSGEVCVHNTIFSHFSAIQINAFILNHDFICHFIQ